MVSSQAHHLHPQPAAADCQPGNGASLTVLAGAPGGPGKLDGAAGAALLYQPSGIVVAPCGTLYVSDSNNCIRRVSPGGEVSLFAGSSEAAHSVLSEYPRGMGSADGTASVARFRHPRGLALDAAGNLYVADSGNHTIRKISPTGHVSTLAGTAGLPGHADARAGAARFNSPGDLAVDAAGTVYVLDTLNHVIRKITPDGLVSTLAGSPGMRGHMDSRAGAARFRFTAPGFRHAGGLALNSRGHVLVADFANRALRKVSPAGDVTTLATGFTGPASLRMDAADNCIVFDTQSGPMASRSAVFETVKKVDAAGVITLLASGNAHMHFSGGALPLALDGAGNIYLAETALNAIRRITPAGSIHTVAGRITSGLKSGTAAAARFTGSFAQLSKDAAGNLYRFDTNAVIWKVAPGGHVSRIDTRQLPGPGFIFAAGAADAAGNLYVANMSASNPSVCGYSAVRKITPDGTVTLLAGGAYDGHSDGVGEAASFSLSPPCAMTVDSSGNVWIGDNSAIRKITPAGEVTTVAGSAGLPGATDGLRTSARLALISGLCADTLGNLFAFDMGRIRKITPEGKVTTLAGRLTNFRTEPLDGNGAAACFGLSGCIACDDANNLFVTDPDFHLVRKVSPTGMVSTVVGRLDRAGTVPGPLPASLFAPFGIAALADGQLALTSGDALVLTQGAKF